LKHLWILAVTSCALLMGCSASSRQIAALKNSPEPATRLAAVQELGKIPADGEKRAQIADALSAATVDPDPQVRKAAVEALGKLGGDEAKEALLAVVQGTNFSRAQYDQLQATDDAGGDAPELLAKLGQAQLELGKDKDALRSFKDLERELEDADPQQSMQHLFTLRTGYTQLREMYLAAGDKKTADDLAERLVKVDEQLDAAQQAGGGMGGMGGFGGFGGGLGGMPFSP